MGFNVLDPAFTFTLSSGGTGSFGAPSLGTFVGSGGLFGVFLPGSDAGTLAQLDLLAGEGVQPLTLNIVLQALRRILGINAAVPGGDDEALIQSQVDGGLVPTVTMP